jgi:hypothetical protein
LQQEVNEEMRRRDLLHAEEMARKETELKVLEARLQERARSQWNDRFSSLLDGWSVFVT